MVVGVWMTVDEQSLVWVLHVAGGVQRLLIILSVYCEAVLFVEGICCKMNKVT